MERIAGVVIPYAPTGLPEHYEVVSTDETLPVYETPDSSKNRKAAMRPVKSVITQRRWLYWAMLATSLAFLISPLLLGCTNDSLPDFIKGFLPDFIEASKCTARDSLFDPLLKFAMRILPDFTSPWIMVLRNSPSIFYALIVLFGVFSVLKAKAWTRTQQLATDAWVGLKKPEQP
jgi:hypothetical protein